MFHNNYNKPVHQAMSWRVDRQRCLRGFANITPSPFPFKTGRLLILAVVGISALKGIGKLGHYMIMSGAGHEFNTLCYPAIHVKVVYGLFWYLRFHLYSV